MLHKKERDNSPMSRKLQKLIWLRHVSRGVMTFGFLASAGGNILHAEKNFIGIILAMLPPTILALAFELVSRVPIRKDGRWFSKALRVGATGAIAAIMATLSYFHQRDAIYSATNGDQLTAYLLPASVDALMVVGSVTLIELGIQIDDLEAAIAGIAVKVAKPVERKPEAPLSGKARVAQAWSRWPQLPIKELAEKAGVSYNYAHSVISELRREKDEDLVAVAA